MKKNFFGFRGVLLAVFLFTGYFGYSQTLWQNAQYGMTAEEVKDVYPNTVSATEGSRADDGSEELLKINEVMISNESFAAGFFFKNNILTCVKLSPNTKYSREQCERVYTLLEKSLAVKYGQPTGIGSGMRWNRRTEHTTWVSEGVNIRLLKEFIGSRIILEVLYRNDAAMVDIDNL
jgi:hypothetical protein